MSFAEVVGAFWVTSLLVLALGWTGVARAAMRLVPMPIVMAMVAGIFLKFALDIVRSLQSDVVVAVRWSQSSSRSVHGHGRSASCRPSSARCSRGRSWPFGLDASPVSIARPSGRAAPLIMPVFSTPAMIELVIPLAITIVFVQHGQGLAVLTQAAIRRRECCHHRGRFGRPPQRIVGAVGTSLTGPTNGLITSTGPHERHYATAIVTAVIAILFGILARLSRS